MSIGDVTPQPLNFRLAQRCPPHPLSCANPSAHATPGRDLAQDLLPGLMEWIFNGTNVPKNSVVHFGEKVGTGKLGEYQLSR